MKRVSNNITICMLTAMTVGMLVACGSDADSEEQPTAPSHGLRVSIPAEMESGTRALNFGDGTGNVQATFATSDVVYVCNVTNNNTVDAVTLSPSANGQTVTLTGTLTGTYDVGDQLKLFYHAGGTASGNASEFSYTGQTGTQASATTKDFAVANATVGEISEGTLKTTSTALFRNTQSFMRLSFTFTDWDGTPITMPTGISSLTITSANSSMGTSYAPLTSTYTTGDYTISTPDLSGNVYLAIPFNESVSSSSDNLTITATTSSGIQYKGTKSAPSTGFKNGKYYSASSPVTLSKTTRPIYVGIIYYLTNSSDEHYRDINGYKIHYWIDGTSTNGDINLSYPTSPEETYKSVGSSYWNGDPQKFYQFTTAEIPKEMTHYQLWNVTSNKDNLWIGSSGESTSKNNAYIFFYDSYFIPYYE